jgi:hypothetical protein
MPSKKIKIVLRCTPRSEVADTDNACCKTGIFSLSDALWEATNCCQLRNGCQLQVKTRAIWMNKERSLRSSDLK